MPRIDSPEEWALIREVYFNPPRLGSRGQADIRFEKEDGEEMWDREIRKKKINYSR